MVIVPRFITANGDADEFTEEKYRELYEEASRNYTDRQFADKAAMFGDSPSHAAWSKYRRGEMVLSRSMKQILRLMNEEQPLPRTLCEIVEDRRLVDPNAFCYAVRENEGGLAKRILLVFGEREIRVESVAQVEHRNVLQPQLHKPRHDHYKSLAVTELTWRIANAWRKKRRLTWDEMLRRAMWEPTHVD